MTDEGQADLGLEGEKGTYLELGVAPGYSGEKASVAFPVKLGFSLNDYYKFAGMAEDSKFGYFSVGGIVTVPISANFNIHGGGELQVYGENLKIVNRSFDDTEDKKTMGIASIGIGFSF